MSIQIWTENLRKIYRRGQETVEALRGVDLTIEEGEFLTVMGPSGCGKSTLLHLIGGIDRPTAGRVFVDGLELSALDEEALTRFRREKVGLVFQFYNLLPTLTALENVELPLVALNYPRPARRRMAQAVLEMVGLGDRLRHKPAELSGGEQQRVAIARAIVANRRLILADEPTGDLDSVSTRQVVDLMWDLNRSLGLTFVVVTHDSIVGERGTRTIYLKDGRIAREERGSGGAEEQRGRGAEGQRGRGAEEQGSKGAEEQRSRGAEEQRGRPYLSAPQHLCTSAPPHPGTPAQIEEVNR